MDDSTTLQTTPDLDAIENSDRQPTSTGQLQTIADACATMKDQLADEAQHIIAGTEQMGKHPTITDACAAMKDQLADEAQHIVGVPQTDHSQTVVADGTSRKNLSPGKVSGISAVPEYIENNPTGIANSSDSEQPQRKELEQAKRALKEANWFEQ